MRNTHTERVENGYMYINTSTKERIQTGGNVEKVKIKRREVSRVYV